MPLLFCLHWSSTADHSDMNEESDVARFRLPRPSISLIRWILRPLAVLPSALIIAFIIHEIVAMAHRKRDNFAGTLFAHDPIIDVEKLGVSVAQFAVYASVYFGIFRCHPKRYLSWTWRTRNGRWPWQWWQLSEEYKTHHVNHSAFDDYLLIFSLALTTIIFVMRSANCSQNSCALAETANICQVDI